MLIFLIIYKKLEINFINIYLSELSTKLISKLKKDKTSVLIINTNNSNAYAEIRRFFIELIENNLSVPVVVRKNFYETLNKEKLQIFSSIDIGGVFCDGFGDGIFLTTGNKLDIHNLNKISFAILQSS